MKPNKLRFTETEDGYRCLFKDGNLTLTLDIAGDRPLEERPESWAYDLYATQAVYCEELYYCTTGEATLSGDDVVPCAACELEEELVLMSVRNAEEPLADALAFARRELAEGGEGLAHLADLPWVVDESGRQLA